MKKVITAVLVILMVMSSSVLALAADMGPKSIDTVLAEIRQELGIYATDPINADKVSPEKLAELGDSVMEAMIGNTAMHDQMDINLGGDGSASLTRFPRETRLQLSVGLPDRHDESDERRHDGQLSRRHDGLFCPWQHV